MYSLQFQFLFVTPLFFCFLARLLYLLNLLSSSTLCFSFTSNIFFSFLLTSLLFFSLFLLCSYRCSVLWASILYTVWGHSVCPGDGTQQRYVPYVLQCIVCYSDSFILILMIVFMRGVSSRLYRCV